MMGSKICLLFAGMQIYPEACGKNIEEIFAAIRRGTILRSLIIYIADGF